MECCKSHLARFVHKGLELQLFFHKSSIVACRSDFCTAKHLNAYLNLELNCSCGQQGN